MHNIIGNNHADDIGGKHCHRYVLANGFFLSLQFIWWVAISLSGQSVFNIYGIASFVSNEAEEQEPTTFLCITQDFPFAKQTRIC